MAENIPRASLSFLTESEAEILLSYMQNISIKGGEKLFGPGDVADELYIIASGRLAVQKFTGFGERTQVVGLLDSGAPVGEGGVLEGQVRDASVVAIVDSTLLCLSRLAFDRVAEEHAGLALKVLKWLLSISSLRLKKSSERLAHIL